MSVVQHEQGSHPQADKRFPSTMRDQWGNDWYASFEPPNPNAKQAGALPAPAESPKPKGWMMPIGPKWLQALFLPPEQYRVVKNPSEIVIDTDRWLADTVTAEADWRMLMQRIAVEGLKYKAGDLPKILDNPPVELLNECGPAPFPPAIVVQAIADGDAWCLGKSEVTPKWAEKYLETWKQSALKMNLLPQWAKREMVSDRLRAELKQK